MPRKQAKAIIMNKNIKRITRKLKQNIGESLSEVLVAMLVIALAMVLLVSMVTAAKKLSEISTDRFERGMNLSNSIESGKTDYNTAGNSADATSIDSSQAASLSISSGKITYFTDNGSFYHFTYQAKDAYKITVPIKLEKVTQNGSTECYLYNTDLPNQNPGNAGSGK